MTYKKVMALANKFIIKLANDRFTNRESDAFFTDKESDTMIDLDLPTFDLPKTVMFEQPETVVGVKTKPALPKRLTEESERAPASHVSDPGAPVPEQRDIYDKLLGYFKNANAELENDLIFLNKNRFWDKTTPYKNRSLVYNFLFNELSKTLNKLIGMPKTNVPDIIDVFVKFMQKNEKSIVDSEKVMYDFLKIEKKRLAPLAIPTIVDIVKKLKGDNSVYEIYRNIINYEIPESFNDSIMTPRIKIASKLHYRKLMLLKLGCEL